MSNENLLDEMLDDLADLPAQKNFPPGAHLATMTVTPNSKKAGAYTVKFKYKMTEEFANPADAESEEAPREGDEAVMFINTRNKEGQVNEFGQGQLKIILVPVAQANGLRSTLEACEATKNGVDVVIVSGIRKSKDPQYADQMTVSKLALV